MRRTLLVFAVLALLMVFTRTANEWEGRPFPAFPKPALMAYPPATRAETLVLIVEGGER